MTLITTLATYSFLLAWPVGGTDQEAASTAQSPGLAHFTPSPDQVDALWKLGKVWGFLKYHHPLIASADADVDWDDELFKALPAVLFAESDEGTEAALAAWAETFPAPEPVNRTLVSPEDSHLLPDLDWIHDRDVLNEAICSYLEAVHAGRHGGEEQRYVQRGPGVGNALFDGEEAYADAKELDAGMRLLALYRFWNIIQWWSPYRDQLDDSWDDVLGEFIPRFLAADSSDQYELELLALAARVKDTHTGIRGLTTGAPPFGSAAIPVVLRFIGGRAVVFRALETSTEGERLQPGDVLLAIDGKPISSMVEELAPLYPASNAPARLRAMSRNLTRGPEGNVSVLVERAGEEIRLEAMREARDPRAEYLGNRRDLAGSPFRLLDEDVAYVKLSSAKVDEVGAYLEQAKDTKGLVIDIRNYPREFMILYELGGHLVTEETPFATFTLPDWETPGVSAWGGMAKLSPKAPYYGGQVVILVDESSISRAEFTTMAFQSVPGAVVVGSTTSGADGNVGPIPLPGGHGSLLSGIGVFYPDQTPTQRVGVAIDVVSVPTVEGLREGRDEVLEEGVRQILGEAAPAARVRRISR